MIAAPDRHVQRRIQLVAAGCAVAALIAVSAAVVVVTSWPSGEPTKRCVDVLAVARGAPPVTQPPPTPRMDPPAQPDLTRDDVEALVATIQQVGDHHVEVPQSTIDKIFANPMAVARTARIVPAVNGGKPDGFRLYAIRPHSVWTAAGLANGDTIRAVNGYDLTLPDKSLELYTRLRSAKEFKIDVERRGRPLAIEVDIK